jgi:2-oxoglutarate ferredoxin oxidoreductase subunit delta
MAGKIIINTERCKGCGLCVTVCPKGGIVISKQSNKTGYFPAQPVPSGVEGASNADCTGCAMCALICPEAIIEVYREDDTSSESRKKSKPPLIKEKT